MQSNFNQALVFVLAIITCSSLVGAQKSALTSNGRKQDMALRAPLLNAQAAQLLLAGPRNQALLTFVAPQPEYPIVLATQEQPTVQEQEVPTCRICWQEFTEPTTQLHCNHRFCTACLDTMLETGPVITPKCPACTKVMTDEEFAGIRRNKPVCNKRCIKVAFSPLKVSLVAAACLVAHDFYLTQPQYNVRMHQGHIAECNTLNHAACELLVEITDKSEQELREAGSTFMAGEPEDEIAIIVECADYIKAKKKKRGHKHTFSDCDNLPVRKSSWLTAIDNRAIGRSHITYTELIYLGMKYLYESW